tara:strand:- start:679 stop:1146 length:468 start_codon:yes stop_codon:yes gene_type:complete
MTSGADADGISSTAYNGILAGSSPACPISTMEHKHWKQLYDNVKLSAKYGAKGGRRALACIDWESRDLEITIDYLKELWDKQNGLCYWLDVPMDPDGLFVAHSPFAPSVDRLVNKNGYVQGNVVLTVRLANRGRGAYEGSDFKERLNQLIEMRNQ